MEIHEDAFNCTEAEIQEMRDLLIRSYQRSLKPFNWRLAMLENWYYASRYLEPVEYFIRRTQLWREPSGKLVAFVLRGRNYSNIQVDYDYRSLEPCMFDWVDAHPIEGKDCIKMLVYDWDLERQGLLERHGYQNLGADEDARIYDLAQAFPAPTLPEGYRFASMAEYDDCSEYVELTNRVWGMTLDEAWFRGKASAPSYSSEWDLLAISPENKMAAYNLVWLYPQTLSAEIDPLGTHPEQRGRGLGRALVLECFKRLAEFGYRHAYIASETNDPIVSHLYSSLNPIETYQAYLWSKPVS